MRQRLPSVATTFAVVALVLSCSDPVQQLPVPTEPLIGLDGARAKSVTVTLSSASIAVNGTVQLIATASPQQSAGTFTWTSSNTTVATVSSSGLVTGVGSGTATISATAGGVTGTSLVTVKAR